MKMKVSKLKKIRSVLLWAFLVLIIIGTLIPENALPVLYDFVATLLGLEFLVLSILQLVIILKHGKEVDNAYLQSLKEMDVNKEMITNEPVEKTSSVLSLDDRIKKVKRWYYIALFSFIGFLALHVWMVETYLKDGKFSMYNFLFIVIPASMIIFPGLIFTFIAIITNGTRLNRFKSESDKLNNQD